jgi:hypothetical protein
LTRTLDLVVDVAACAAAGDLLYDGSGVGGQLGPIVQDPELAVLDGHGDDLATVDMTKADLRLATMKPAWLEISKLICMASGGIVGGGR